MFMDTEMEGKVALVTGGAGGIGQSICRHLSAEGAIVAIHYHTSENDAEKLASEIGGFTVNADLRIPSEARKMISNIVSKVGGLDICVANSGHYPSRSLSFWEIDDERWESTISSNLGVAVNTSRAFLEHASVARSGSLVLVGSTAGVYGEAGHSDYATAKGAITSGLLLTLKNDVAKIGNVRVNAVAPGWTITKKKEIEPPKESSIGRAQSTMALKKFAIPEDVARAVVMLSSNATAGHITGQIIEIAGGMEGRII